MQTISMQQNNGTNPVSRRERAAPPFDDFDPQTLLQEPFSDDSAEKLVSATGNRSHSLTSSAMDYEPEQSRNVEPAFMEAHNSSVMETHREGNQSFYQSQGLTQYQPSQDQRHQNSVGNHDVVDGRGYPLYPLGAVRPHVPLSQLSGGVSTDTSSFSFNNNQCVGEAQLAQGRRSAPHNFGDAAGFDVNRVQARTSLMQQKNLEGELGIASMKQGYVAPSNNIGVNVQLEAMEKLSESMRRSAVTRNIIKSLSNRSVASQGTTGSIDEDLSSCLSSEGSGQNLVAHGSGRQHHTMSAPGRGHGRGITVSGRGVGRQSSGKNVSMQGDPGFDRITPYLASVGGINSHGPGEDEPPASGSGQRRSYPSSQSPTSSTLPQITDRYRGMQRHRSNPTLTHRLNQIENGAMDIQNDGMGDTDSV